MNRIQNPASGLWRSAAGLALALLLGVPLTPAASGGVPLPRGEDGVPTLAPVLRGVTPAVVNISVRTRSAASNNPLLKDPFFRRFFNLPEGQGERDQSAGSGVIIDAEQGFVVTNHHVIENAQEVTVTLKDRRKFQAQFVGSDPGTDIALLKIPAENLTALEIGDSDGLEVGDFVIAIGNPFGLGQTVTSGIVSALGRSGLNIEGYEDFIQTDASINPGNSGGALIDLHGRLIGVNTAIIGPSGGNVGIGFAVPSNMAFAVVDQLVAYGEVRRGRLGIQIQDLTAEVAEALNLAANARGVVITSVQRGSSAQRAGLQPGDVVVEVDGRRVDDLVDLRNRIGLTPVGQQVDMKVLRNGEPQNLAVTIGSPDGGRPQVLPGEEEDEAVTEMTVPKLAGAVFRDIEPGDQLGGESSGVVIDEVARGSPAWAQGLRAGDLIFGLNQTRVDNLEELAGVLRQSGGVLAFNVLRGDTRLFVIVQ